MGNAYLMTLLGLRLSIEELSAGVIGWILAFYSIGFVAGTESNTDVIAPSECSLCDLSVPCFRIADRVNPYLKKDRFYQKAANSAHL